MSFWQKIRGFVRKNQSGIIIGLSLLAVANLVSLLVYIVKNGWSKLPVYVPEITFSITLFIAIASVVSLIFLNRFYRRYKQSFSLIADHLGYSYERDQYVERLSHWPAEKLMLARYLVEEQLPSIFKTVVRQLPELEKVNLIIDAGSTTTPVFAPLQALGIRGTRINESGAIRVELHTNNFAGIREMYRLESWQPHHFDTKDITLIGGNPLHKYRATGGDDTEAYLRGLWTKQRPGKVISIGILTANWFVCASELTDIRFCARGKPHFEFKRLVADNADYLVYLSPLGKLLRVSRVAQLNNLDPHAKIDPDNKYLDHPLQGRNSDEGREKKRDHVFLLTSYRSPKSTSGLRNSAEELRRHKLDDDTKNYVLCEKYEKLTASYEDDPNREFPHEWTRDHLDKLYHCYRK